MAAWSVEKEPGLDDVYYVIDDADDLVCNVSTPERGRLIAAAPEMLEALKAVADCKFCILCQTCRNKVDAAIAKTEGRDAQ